MAASISAAVLMPDTLAGKLRGSKWCFGVNGVWQARVKPSQGLRITERNEKKGAEALVPQPGGTFNRR